MKSRRENSNFDDSIPGIWTNWVIFLIGIWLMFAPWIWGYSWQAAPVWSDVITGIILVIGALSALTYRFAFPRWWSLLPGVWLIISPFVLGYAFIPRAQANDIIVGVIVIVIGLIAALSNPLTYTGRPVEG